MNPSESIDYMTQHLLIGAGDALMGDIDAYVLDTEAAPDVLSVAGFAAVLFDRPLAARTLASRACAARSRVSTAGDPESEIRLEDATSVAWDLALGARFSSATDCLRFSVHLRPASARLVPLIAVVRIDVLVRASTEADIPVWDASSQRLLLPEEVRRDAVEQVSAELAACVERCRGKAEAPRMARELVRLGARFGNTKENWGHVFAATARTIDDSVEGAESLFLM